MVQPQLHAYVPGYSIPVLQRDIEQQYRSSKRPTKSSHDGLKLSIQFWDQVMENMELD